MKIVQHAAFHKHYIKIASVLLLIDLQYVAYYEKYGFEKIDELENYAGGRDHIFMKKC